jgi:hypothetical protein
MIETLLMGLMAQEMNNEVAHSNDVSRFAEICNGAPMNAIEQAAIMSILGRMMGQAQAQGTNPCSNPFIGLLGGLLSQPQAESENPIAKMFEGMI